MSVADHSLPLANLSRRAPFTVRLAPQFVNRMWDRLQKPAPARANVAGLLFGRSEIDLSEIQVFRSLPEETRSAQLSPDSALVEDLLASSRKDPEVANLQLLGWYAFRPTGGLHENDVAFHNRHFLLPNEIALILRPELHPDVLFEIYSRSGTALLSEEEHRWGSLRLASDTTVAGPIDIAMRAKIGDDFYLRAYQVSKNLDRAERREQWASTVHATKITVRSIFRRKRKDVYSRNAALSLRTASLPPLPPAAPQSAALPPETPRSNTSPAIGTTSSPRPLAQAAAAATPGFAFPTRPTLPQVASPDPSPTPSFPTRRQDLAPSTLRPPTALQTIHAGDPPALPAVIKPPRTRVPWLSSIIIAAAAAALTFGLFYYQQFSSAGTTGFLRALFPDPGLSLRVEGQGDRVLLSWNRRNAIVKSSLGGVLHIDDGTQHRDVRLDPAQIANGSVLYRPGSDDVSFRLEVHGQAGSAIVETTRVLDGAKTTPVQVKTDPPDLSPAISAAASAPASSSNVFVPAPQGRVLRSSPMTPPPASLSAPSPAPDTQQTAAPTPDLTQAAARPEPSSAPASLNPAPLRTEQTPASASASLPAPENHPLPAETEPTGQTANPVAATTPPDAPQQQDSKLSNWEDTLSGRNAEPSQPRPAPATAPPGIEGSSTATFVPPKPTRQVLPDLRSFGIASITATAQVEVTVKVNNKGRVTAAYLDGNSSKIPPHIAHAALNAARQWTFAPATLRGKSVPSDHTIVFEFRPAGR